MKKMSLMLAIYFMTINLAMAHHQIAYLAPADKGMVAFLSSGHHLPMGENFSGLASYEETAIITPSGKKYELTHATNMGLFGFSYAPLTEKGLYIFNIAAEHYGTKTTQGYFRGPKKEALKAGRKVIEAKHTFRYSKSYRWNGDGPAPKLSVGHDIEMVPDNMPKVLKKGDKLAITLLFKGKPAADMIIGATAMKKNCGNIAHPDEKDKFMQTVITDKNGRAELEMVESGWVIFVAEKLIENPEPDVDKLYYSTVLTIWVEK
ncbi:MAG: DUF4198 domain-containing protein [Calditrichaeota bacterium]|nr:DUF4198 domain-containing protein [Calditrichota bacterium]